MTGFADLSAEVRRYLLVTANYWAFTLTDGALRMLVVLHFHQLGYSPLAIAMLFIFYEFFGVVTNLVGGWLGARLGLNRTMNIGLGLQVFALLMLTVPAALLTVPWVMAAQALSGIAKDLNKMSAKSSIKALVPKDQDNRLFRWVAFLTGSKNTLKGAGFFLGGGLLTWLGFQHALLTMAMALSLVWLGSLFMLRDAMGKAKNKPRFRDIFSKSPAINTLSAARLFLFASRDVWFVVALPVFLSQQFQWDFWQVGGFLAVWIICYGVVQSVAPGLIQRSLHTPAGGAAILWAALLALTPIGIACGFYWQWPLQQTLLLGLIAFGVLFAINSSLHSFLIVRFANADGVSLDVGFYYMANAMGRLIGTVLSGWVFQAYGIAACLWVSGGFIIATALISFALPRSLESSPDKAI